MHWNAGEPNQYCADEDCALLSPTTWPGWIDASCGAKAACVCRLDADATVEFVRSIPALTVATPDYDHCDDDDDEAKHREELIMDSLNAIHGETTVILVLFVGLLAVACALAAHKLYLQRRNRSDGENALSAIGVELSGGDSSSYNHLNQRSRSFA